MNIEELLNKYFEGETTCEEERELCRFFTQGIVPEHLREYRPLFAFLEEEKKKSNVSEMETPKPKAAFRHRLLYTISGIAAGLLLLLGVAGIHRHFNVQPDNYVIIDGKCYTDENLVHEEAMAAFRNVSISENELRDTLFGE